MTNEYFSPSDRSLIESVSYDMNAAIDFDNMRDCLYWKDERPDGLTSDGYEKLLDLMIARKLIYHLPQIGKDPSQCILPGDELDNWRRRWDRALKQHVNWPGFRRIELSDSDKAFYEQCLHKNASGWGFL